MVRFALLLIATAACCAAASLQQLSLDQVIGASTEIVRGKVTKSYVEDFAGTLYTHYVIAVSERWKGAEQAESDVAVPGGTLGNKRQTFAGIPALLPGVDYVLFLWKGAAGPRQILGLNQGIFRLSTGADGQAVATRDAISEMMLSANGSLVHDSGVRLPLTDMRARVSAANHTRGAQ